MGVIIGNKELDIPLIQGGMGIGISMGRLAGAVAAEGGMGTISAAGIGFREEDFEDNIVAANDRALKKEIALAKKLSGGRGMIAVNIMTAMNYFDELVKSAIEGGADLIISGAGLPKSLPALTKDTGVLAAPVVSSGRTAKVICQLWDRRYETIPDLIVIEGSNAGGHLGFSAEELADGSCSSLDEILVEVMSEIRPYQEKYGRKIPVFVAGGIRTREEIKHYIDAGADGVQLATAFIATEECDATDKYKNIMINASNSEIRIVKSPVGMPGRAIESPLMKRVAELGRIAPEACRACIRACRPAETVYCISNALIAAWKGDYENGLFFCGSDISCLDRVKTVKSLIKSLFASKMPERE